MAPIKEQAIDKYPYIQYMGRFYGMSESFSGSTNKRYSSKHGFVKYLSVEGKSEKWNQLYQHPRSDSYTENGITRVYGSANDITFIGQASTTGIWYINNSTWPMTFYAGHKYLLQIIPSGTVNNGVYLFFTQSSTAISSGAVIVAPSSTTSSNGVLRIMIDNGTDCGVGYTVALSVYDLTAIFGAGNEPATVDAFKATDVYKAKLAAGELYDYDAGSLVSIESVTVGGTTIETALRGLPQGKGDELQVDSTTVIKFDRTYYDTISTVGTVNTSGSTWYAALTTTNQATLRRNWTSADDFNADKGTTDTDFAYCTKTEKISATGKGICIARTWNGLYAYCTAADAQELGITESDFTALVGASVIARNKTAIIDLPSINPIEISSGFEVKTEFDTTFEMVSGAV